MVLKACMEKKEPGGGIETSVACTESESRRTFKTNPYS